MIVAEKTKRRKVKPKSDRPPGLPKTLSFKPAKAAPADVKAGPTVADTEKMKAAARSRAPSEPWVDVQFPQHVEIVEDEEVMITTHVPGLFPPGGDMTGMVRCAGCGVMFPPTCKTFGGRGFPLCVDHLPMKSNNAYGTSPSAMAIRQACAMHKNTAGRARVVERELPPEDLSALRREIRQAK